MHNVHIAQYIEPERQSQLVSVWRWGCSRSGEAAGAHRESTGTQLHEGMEEPVVKEAWGSRN